MMSDLHGPERIFNDRKCIGLNGHSYRLLVMRKKFFRNFLSNFMLEWLNSFRILHSDAVVWRSTFDKYSFSSICQTAPILTAMEANVMLVMKNVTGIRKNQLSFGCSFMYIKMCELHTDFESIVSSVLAWGVFMHLFDSGNEIFVQRSLNVTAVFQMTKHNWPQNDKRHEKNTKSHPLNRCIHFIRRISFCLFKISLQNEQNSLPNMLFAENSVKSSTLFD